MTKQQTIRTLFKTSFIDANINEQSVLNGSKERKEEIRRKIEKFKQDSGDSSKSIQQLTGYTRYAKLIKALDQESGFGAGAGAGASTGADEPSGEEDNPSRVDEPSFDVEDVDLDILEPDNKFLIAAKMGTTNYEDYIKAIELFRRNRPDEENILMSRELFENGVITNDDDKKLLEEISQASKQGSPPNQPQPSQPPPQSI